MGPRQARAPTGDAYVDVALPLPLLRSFTYRVEGPTPEPGTRVLVPFRRTERVGWVLGPGDPTGIRGVRSVLDVVEAEPSVAPELLRLATWIGEYYIAPVGVVLRSMLPSVLSDGSRELVRATEAGERGTGLSPRAERLLEAVAGHAGPVQIGPLRRRLDMGSIWPEVRALVEAGLLERWTEPPPAPPIRTRRVVEITNSIQDLALRDEVFKRAARQRECFESLEAAGGTRALAELLQAEGFSRSVVTGLEEKALVRVHDQEVLRDPFAGAEPPAAVPLTPTGPQRVAIDALLGALADPCPRPFVLHGVTGSGKTLVYIELLREVVGERGRGAIVLVPEISLTPQTVSRFRAWFGDEVAVLHSGLSDGERFDQWRQIRSGQKRIVVGARSALFAPLRDLGVIIVDEEHEGSYKQSEAPRYHARDVAVMRARLSGALCVLGSATPSLESWRNAQRGKFRVLSLPSRVGGRPMPPVSLVDLRKERGSGVGHGEGSGVLSPRLVYAVRDALARREQCILLLNRRGYSSFIQCRSCGEVRECPQCSVSLTFHRRRGRLLCHHCRHEEEAPKRCERCGSTEIGFHGMGTEQVERVVTETFPQARVARMDVDTTSGKWSHAEILGRVERREVDILLGTQMIAKGLDFPWVTLVGVVNADVGLHLPDFRASERTFQLLSQVAGRAGRGDRGGEVIIQTSLPGHYAVQAALSHDFEGFAEEELTARKSPPYPPLVRLVNVVLSSPVEELAVSGAESAARWVGERLGRAGAGANLVGPAPAPIERLHGRWRWHFFVRGGSVREITNLLTGLVEAAPLPSGDVRLAIDRDPVALL